MTDAPEYEIELSYIEALISMCKDEKRDAIVDSLYARIVERELANDRHHPASPEAK